MDGPPDTILSSILQQVAEALPADVVAVLLLDAQARTLGIEAIFGLAGQVTAGVRYDLEQGLGGKAVLSGEPVFAKRQTGEPHFAWPELQQRDLLSGVAVPIIQAGEVIGVLEAYRTGEQPFDAHQAAVLAPLGGSVVLALENRSLLLQEAERRQRANALLDIAQATTSSLDMNEVLEKVVSTTARLTGADRCSIWLLDEEKGRLVSAAIYGSIDPEFAARWRRQSFALEEQKLSHWVLTQGQALVIFDAAAHPLTDKRAVSFFGDKSILVVPLSCRGEALGTLFLNHIYRYHAFSDEEVEFTLTLANQAAVAIHNAQLFEATREGGESLRWAMRQMGNMPPRPDSEAVFRLTVDVASRLLRVPVCTIRVVDEQTGELYLRAAKGLPPSVMQEWRLRPGQGPSGRVVERGEPVLFDDLWEQPDVRYPAFVHDAGLRGYLGVPLLIKGRAVGVLNVYTHQPHQFSPEEVDLLSSFANQAALGIENVTLFQDLQRRAEELSLLHEVSTALNATLDLPQVLEVIAHSALQITHADRTALFLIDESTQEVERAVDIPLRRESVRERPRADGLTNHVRRSGSIELIPDALADPRVRPELIEEGIRSILGMPLRIDGETVGVLWINSTRPKHFSKHQVDLLAVVANQVAVALKNARLYTYVVQEKEKFAAIFTNSTDGILLIDGQRHIMAINPALGRMLGWRVEEAQGRPCVDVLNCRDRLGAGRCDNECLLERALGDAGTSRYLEATLETRDGRAVEVAASFSLIPQPEEGMPFAVCIIRDVTEARRVEEAKSDFVSLVSHELRTPLSLVKGYSSTLLRPDLEIDATTQRRFLVNIDEAANRLARLINDLLSISRMEMGRFELKRQVVDLRSIADKVSKEVGQLTANHRLRVALPSAALPVNADQDRVEQVLLNLLRNAVAYSAAGTQVVLTAGTASEVDQLAQSDDGVPPWLHGTPLFAPLALPRQGAWAVVRIADEGEGMPQAEMQRIFEKFYRVDRGLESRTSGMGIGLYLAKGFVEAHGGRIWVRSAKGKGSIFAFCLPLQQH